MQVELRRFKSYPRLSEETTAFNADLWIDGQKAGTCENSGKGGPNDVHITDPATRQAFSAYVAALPPEPSQWGPLPMSEDLFIGLLVEKAEQVEFIARKTKKHVIFRLAGDAEGSWRQANIVGTREATIAYWRGKYGDRITEIH